MLRSILSPLLVLSLFFAAAAPSVAQEGKVLYKLGLVLDKGKKDREIAEDVLNAATRAFFESKRFTLVERSQLDAVFTEKDLQGFLGKGNKELSDVLGLDMLGIVAYTTEQTSAGTLFTIEVRLVDVKTGGILATLTSERSDYLTPPSAPRVAGKALFQNIREAFPPFGSVVKVSGKNVIVDLGSESGVKKGDAFEIVQEGEQIIHPKTGEVLSAEMIVIGELKVISTSPQLATCKVTRGDSALGSIVRFKGRNSILNKTIRGIGGVWDRVKH
ncbi:MAG TPA: CsgG/HfaB family protein [Thermoanaerobaculia bacterium]|nr:CsgG/HfaB family protein [Thermoanaerobaculia bacterium]